ncbi:MAG TPA: 30S ribosomal protein S8 [Patescibacteria group bacterium]|nr:30S ribosomal protein S8 [Patescibacteria group bacterium]
MYTDPIADFLTRIRNAQSAHHEVVAVPGSRLKFAIAKILEREGYIETAKEQAEGPRSTIQMRLKYLGRMPYIRSLHRISTPGRRVYRGASELPRVLSDQGIAIISTSAGVMTNKEARKRRLGGEVLCEIY